MTETVDSLTATKESRPQLSEVKVEDRENGKGKKEKLWRRIKKRIPFWRRKAETEPNEVVEEVAEMRDGLPEDWDDLYEPPVLGENLAQPRPADVRSEMRPQEEYYRHLFHSIAEDIDKNSDEKFSNLDQLPEVSLPDTSYEYEAGGFSDFQAWLESDQAKSPSNRMHIKINHKVGEETKEALKVGVYIVNVRSPKGVKKFLLLKNLTTEYGHRRKGLGKYVVRQLQKEAMGLGVDALVGEMGRKDGLGVEERERFYREQNGFKVLGDGTGDSGMAAIYWKVPN